MSRNWQERGRRYGRSAVDSLRENAERARQRVNELLGRTPPENTDVRSRSYNMAVQEEAARNAAREWTTTNWHEINYRARWHQVGANTYPTTTEGRMMEEHNDRRPTFETLRQLRDSVFRVEENPADMHVPVQQCAHCGVRSLGNGPMRHADNCPTQTGHVSDAVRYVQEGNNTYHYWGTDWNAIPHEPIIDNFGVAFTVNPGIGEMQPMPRTGRSPCSNCNDGRYIPAVWSNELDSWWEVTNPREAVPEYTRPDFGQVIYPPCPGCRRDDYDRFWQEYNERSAFVSTTIGSSAIDWEWLKDIKYGQAWQSSDPSSKPVQKGVATTPAKLEAKLNLETSTAFKQLLTVMKSHPDLNNPDLAKWASGYQQAITDMETLVAGRSLA